MEAVEASTAGCLKMCLFGRYQTSCKDLAFLEMNGCGEERNGCGKECLMLFYSIIFKENVQALIIQ